MKSSGISLVIPDGMCEKLKPSGNQVNIPDGGGDKKRLEE